MSGGDGRQGGSRWTASLLSVVLCPNLLFPSFCLNLLSASLSPLFRSVFSSLLSSSFHPLFFHVSFLPLPPSFTLCCLVADGSVGQQQQQQQQSRSQSVSKRWGEGKGVVERGEKGWGSGIWRAWLRGPLTGSVCACGSGVKRRGVGYNRCPLRERFDSNRQRRGETDRQINRQTCRMAQRKTWKGHVSLSFGAARICN